MEEQRATVKDSSQVDLLVVPHIVGKLIDLLRGAWQPEPFQQDQLVAHLMECSSCRAALIVLLSAEWAGEKRHCEAETTISNLLRQLKTIRREIEAQGYESMGAYAEAIVARGREEAEKQFPILAEHIRRCSSCKSMLEETVAFLRETEETG